MKQFSEYSLLNQNSFFHKLLLQAREQMHEAFLKKVSPSNAETILDVGVSANPQFQASNFLEWACPHLKLTALGVEESTPQWQQLYPHIPYIKGSALALPFEDKSFDIVYSHAVIEHVGSFENQIKMLSEALRVARRAIFITTPNRWHPMEFHTLLPLLHWLPKSFHRMLLRKFRLQYFSLEENLNLLDKKYLIRATQIAMEEIADEDCEMKIYFSKFFGLNANLLLCVYRNP